MVVLQVHAGHMVVLRVLQVHVGPEPCPLSHHGFVCAGGHRERPQQLGLGQQLKQPQRPEFE